MTTTAKWLVGTVVALILGVTIGAFLFNSRPHSFGTAVINDVQWFTSGFKYGTNGYVYSSAVITINKGQDQGVWRNTTGRPVTVIYTPVFSVASSSTYTVQASSTFSVAVGATSTATISEPFKLNPWVSTSSAGLLVTNFTVPTTTLMNDSTQSLDRVLLTDNYASHASTTVGNLGATIIVPNNNYLFVKIDTPCNVQGLCEQATSSGMGWNQIIVPFQYYYPQAN